MTRLTAHCFLKASQKAEPKARRKGNAKKSLACPRLPRRFLKTARNDGQVARQRHAKPPPLRRGLGVGCQRHATPRACRFSQKQSFKTLAARVIHERNLNAKRFFARAKLPFSFYALFLWQAAAFLSKEKAHGKGRVFVILSRRRRIHTLILWILRFAQYDKGRRQTAFQKKAKP